MLSFDFDLTFDLSFDLTFDTFVRYAISLLTTRLWHSIAQQIWALTVWFLSIQTLHYATVSFRLKLYIPLGHCAQQIWTNSTYTKQPRIWLFIDISFCNRHIGLGELWAQQPYMLMFDSWYNDRNMLITYSFGADWTSFAFSDTIERVGNWQLLFVCLYSSCMSVWYD